MTKESFKEAVLELLAKGGEYTRGQLAALLTPSDCDVRLVEKASGWVVEMDLADEVSVRIAGGEAHYSKLKVKRERLRITPGNNTMHRSKRGGNAVAVDSVKESWQ
jgi:hypothetical protein